MYNCTNFYVVLMMITKLVRISLKHGKTLNDGSRVCVLKRCIASQTEFSRSLRVILNYHQRDYVSVSLLGGILVYWCSGNWEVKLFNRDP